MSSNDHRGLRTASRTRNGENSAIRNPQSAMVAAQPSFVSPQSLEVHIEELVLHGFAPADRYRIADAVQAELARVILEGGVPVSLIQTGELASVPDGSFDLPPTHNPKTIGLGIASAVHSALGAPAAR